MHGECLLQILGSNCPSLTPPCVSQRGAHCTCTQLQSHKWQKSSSLRFPSCATQKPLWGPILVPAQESEGTARSAECEPGKMLCHPLVAHMRTSHCSWLSSLKTSVRALVAESPQCDFLGLPTSHDHTGATRGVQLTTQMHLLTECYLTHMYGIVIGWLRILAWAAYCEQFPVQPAWDWAQAHSIQVELIGKGRGMLSPRRTQDTLANPGTQDTLAGAPNLLSDPKHSIPQSEHEASGIPVGNKIRWGVIVSDLEVQVELWKHTLYIPEENNELFTQLICH